MVRNDGLTNGYSLNTFSCQRQHPEQNVTKKQKRLSRKKRLNVASPPHTPPQTAMLQPLPLCIAFELLWWYTLSLPGFPPLPHLSMHSAAHAKLTVAATMRIENELLRPPSSVGYHSMILHSIGTRMTRTMFAKLYVSTGPEVWRSGSTKGPWSRGQFQKINNIYPMWIGKNNWLK